MTVFFLVPSGPIWKWSQLVLGETRFFETSKQTHNPAHFRNQTIIWVTPPNKTWKLKFGVFFWGGGLGGGGGGGSIDHRILNFSTKGGKQ